MISDKIRVKSETLLFFMISIAPNLMKHFKRFRSSAEVIMTFVYMKLRYSLSYRDIEEMAVIRNSEISIDHSTLQRWVCRFSGIIEKRV